jgi:hypothetical protein
MISGPIVIAETRRLQSVPSHLAYHRAIPELWVEADSPEAAARRLADRLASTLREVPDAFHREVIRRSAVDVDRWCASLRDAARPPTGGVGRP